MNTPLHESPNLWTRRQFLQALAGGGGALSALADDSFVGFPPPLTPGPFDRGRAVRRQLFRMVRPFDSLELDLELLNLRVTAPPGSPGAHEIHPLSYTRPGYLLLHFPGQHIAEQAIWDRSNQGVPAAGDPAPPLTYQLSRGSSTTTDDLLFLKQRRVKDPQIPAKLDPERPQPQGLAGGWLCGPSLLVFEVPQWALPMPFDVDVILDACAHQFPMVVAPTMEMPGSLGVPPGPRSQEPLPPTELWQGRPRGEDPPYTAIEFPSLLYLSPYRNGRWRQRPVTGPRRSAVWAFELEAPRAMIASGVPRDVRAPGHLFALGYRPLTDALWPQPDQNVGDSGTDKYSPFERPKTGLYDATRKLLVKQVGEDNGDVVAEKLRLTSRGATARLSYRPAFEPPGTQQGNGEGALKEGEARWQRLHSALELVGLQLNSTQLDSIAAKVWETSKDSLAAAWGKVKPLIPAPQLSQAKWALLETAFTRVEGTFDEGMLLEWIQKTESGRDFFTKETFAGVWMPHCFKGEVVTITERLPTHTAVVKASPDPAKGADPVDPDKLEKQESELTAFLVARKFARVRPWRDGQMVREFGPAESADFTSWVSQSVRTAGLRSVRILQDRTPVLANKAPGLGADDSLESVQIEAIKLGKDAVVDAGDGTKAAREIFWPRVEEYVPDNAGVPQRQISLFKFDIELTYLDGRTEIVQQPMLFVPTEAKGAALYPHAPESMRSVRVRSRVAAVVPAPPATFSGRDLGSLDALITKLGTKHLKGFLAEPKALALANDPGKPVASAAGLDVFATSLNLVLDNLPDELARRLTAHRENIHSHLTGTFTFLQASLAQLDTDWQNLEAWLVAQCVKMKRDVRKLGTTLERCAAWGVEDIGTITSAYAAERLVKILQRPRVIAADFTTRVRAAVDALKRQVDAAGPAGDVSTTLKALLDAVSNALDNPVPAEYQWALRRLSIQWAVGFGAVWRREEWDKTYRRLVCLFDAKLPVDLAVSLLHKQMHLAVLEGTTTLDIDLGGNGVTVNFDPWKAMSTDLVPQIRPQQLAQEVQKVIQELLDGAVQRLEVVERVLAGVEAALGEERVLRQRLIWVMEQHSRLAGNGSAAALKALREELQPVFADLATQLTFRLAHFADGATAWIRFLQHAFPAAELARHYEREVRKEIDTLRQKARDQAGKLIDEGSAQKTLEQYVAMANPGQVRKQLEEIINLAGGRVADEITAGLERLRAAADAQMQGVQEALDKPAQAQARTFADARRRVEEVFQVAESILGPHRQLLEALLTATATTAAAKLAAQLRAAVKKAIDGIPLSSLPKHVKPWLQQAADMLEADLTKARLSVRFFTLLDDLAADILVATALGEAGMKAVSEFRQRLQTSYLGVLQGVEKVTAKKVQEWIQELKRLAAGAQGEVLQRLDALAALTQSLPGMFMDLLDQVLVSLAALPRELESQVQDVLKVLLKSLQSNFGQALGPAWQRVQKAVDELRGYLGDVQDFTTAVDNLSVDLKAQAKAAHDKLVVAIKPVADTFTKELTTRAEQLEGETFAFVKRALVSLPSAEMLDSFADQARKAVFTTSELVFDAMALGENLRSMAAFPKLQTLKVKLPGSDVMQAIQHTEDYVRNGLRDIEAAKGQIFAELTAQAKALGESAGIANIETEIKNLSREAGALSRRAAQAALEYGTQTEKAVRQWAQDLPLAGLAAPLKEQAAQLKAHAQDIFAGMDLQLFNAIDLTDILGLMSDLRDLPKTISNELPDRIENVISLRKKVEDYDMGGLLKFLPAKGTELSVDNRTTVWLPLPGQPNRGISTTVRGQLGPFHLTIGSVIGIHFQSLSFVAENGDFKCQPKLGKGIGGDLLEAVEFLESLAFLQDLIDTFGKFLSGLIPLKLSFDGESIFAGIQIGLPSLGFGVFSLTNLNLGFSVGLPLSGSGSLKYRFNISDRVETFKLSVCGFAGGGFFALQAGSRKEDAMIEAAIEFGGSLSLDFVVASGSLSVMAGFYYRSQQATVHMEAYLRACGSLRALGIVEVSVIFYLGLGYVKAEAGGCSMLEGTASVTIRVKIAFFSKSFGLTYHKTIAGSRSNESSKALRLMKVSTRFLAEQAKAMDRRQFVERVSLGEWRKHWHRFSHGTAFPCGAVIKSGAAAVSSVPEGGSRQYPEGWQPLPVE